MVWQIDMRYDYTQQIQVNSHLVIRPYRPEDAEPLFPHLLAEKADLFMINSIDKMVNIDDLRSEIDRVNALLHAGKRLGGAVELEGKIVGSCRIAGISFGEDGDLGYWLFREARGRGIITKCSATLLDIAFSKLKLQRVTIRAAPSNTRSVAVAQRLGFKFSHIAKHCLFRGGQWWDAAVYVMSRGRWVELHGKTMPHQSP